MTSSYNISRRPPQKGPHNFDAHIVQNGVCPLGYTAHPIAPTSGRILPDGTMATSCSGWKMCLPILNEDGNIPSVVTNRQILDSYAKTGKRHFVKNLYNLDEVTKTNPMGYAEQNRTNFYPRSERSSLVDRKELDEKDYFQLPINYDGTGYKPNRAWIGQGGEQNYKGGYYPAYATDYIELSKDFDRTQLIQRSSLKPAYLEEQQLRNDLGVKPFQQIVRRT